MTNVFFGYGSLVNLRTHTNEAARPARLEGWQRVWRPVADHGAAVLSVMPGDGHILGVIAQVPGGDWAALDAREHAYERQRVALHDPQIDSALYVVTRFHAETSQPAPVLLSYLDVVCQGFHDLYGPEGVAHFFDTTQHWPDVHDDRAAPLYPRAQTLSAPERALVDTHLARVMA